jgi:hypothetical protein
MSNPSLIACVQEETQRLREEVQRLTVELKELEFRGLSADDVALLDPEVKQLVAENRLMTSVAKNQQLTVARVQSVLAANLVRVTIIPMRGKCQNINVVCARDRKKRIRCTHAFAFPRTGTSARRR